MFVNIFKDIILTNMNRFLILILLLALLYALYKYQDTLPNENTDNKEKRITYFNQNKEIASEDNVSIDNISQAELGSLADVKSFGLYKQDSLMDSDDTVISFTEDF